MKSEIGQITRIDERRNLVERMEELEDVTTTSNRSIGEMKRLERVEEY